LDYKRNVHLKIFIHVSALKDNGITAYFKAC